MSDDPSDATHAILVRIQQTIGDLRSSVEQRLDRLEDIARRGRRDSAGMIVMMRATAGDFDERVREVEERVEAPERRGAGS